jgi:hypothetical protein
LLLALGLMAAQGGALAIQCPMTMEEKNKFSHRQKAVTKLFTFLHSI